MVGERDAEATEVPAYDWRALVASEIRRSVAHVHTTDQGFAATFEKTVEGNYSEAHRRRLRQWIPFAMIASGPERVALFEKVAGEMDWSPRTQATYFACLQSTMKLVGVQQTQAEILKKSTGTGSGPRSATLGFGGWGPSSVQRNDRRDGDAGSTIAAELPGERGSAGVVLGPTYGGYPQAGEGEFLQPRGGANCHPIQGGKDCEFKGPFLTHSSNPLAARSVGDTNRGKVHRFSWEAFSEGCRRDAEEAVSYEDRSQEQLLLVSRHASVEMLNLYLHNGMFNVLTLAETAQIIDRACNSQMPLTLKLFVDTASTEI